MKPACWVCIAAFSCAILGGQSAVAVPLTYDESVGGDIELNGFAFGVGSNTITGRMRFVTNLPFLTDPPTAADFDVDVDVFSFAIPAGAALVSARAQTTFIDTTQNTMGIEALWELRDGEFSGPILSETCFTLVGDPGSVDCSASSGGGPLFSSALPLGKIFYSLDYRGTWWGAMDTEKSYGGDINYVLSFDVQEVPEPCTIALLGLGLVGLATSRRREQVSVNA